MKYLIFLIPVILTACSLFQPMQSNEMERVSEDVLSNKSHSGISIQIVPIPEQEKK